MDYGSLRNNQNWNIGFCNITPEELVREKSLPKIHWLRHEYNDRFFADPFILLVDDDSIYVLVEEMKFFTKGVISLLKVDRKSYNLTERKVLLEKDSHLSYPAIFVEGGKIYVYPENYQSGELNLYELDTRTFALNHVGCMMELPLTDATVRKGDDGRYYMLSTLASSSRSGAFLYASDSLKGGYSPVSSAPVVTGPDKSRCGGNFFEAEGKLYRPAQNSSSRYGQALKVMEVTGGSDGHYSETEAFDLRPSTWKYNLGLHTLNFSPDWTMAVIDSYGYLYPFTGRVLESLSKLIHKFV